MEGTNTFQLIKFADIPQDRRHESCHSMVVCEVKPHKEYPNRTPITVAGSQICYPGDVGTPTGSLNLVNLIINRVLSRRNAPFVSFDLKTYISKPRWINLNMCASSSEISLKNSLRNTTSAKPLKMDGSISKSSADVTAYHNLTDWQTFSCVPVSREQAIMKPPQHRASSATSGVPSNSFYLWTTLALNM